MFLFFISLISWPKRTRIIQQLIAAMLLPHHRIINVNKTETQVLLIRLVNILNLNIYNPSTDNPEIHHELNSKRLFCVWNFSATSYFISIWLVAGANLPALDTSETFMVMLWYEFKHKKGSNSRKVLISKYAVMSQNLPLSQNVSQVS